jgi:acetyl-CoA acetyltransferase
MGQRVYVIGVGITKFEKPGARNWDYPDMAREAIGLALTDAKINYGAVQQVAVGYCYGDSTAGQRAVYEAGLTGVPIYNVNNNCATGSTALYLAKQLIEGGIADCALAVGFEKMEKGSLGVKYADRTNPLDKHFQHMIDLRGLAHAPGAPQLFGNAGREYAERYGAKPEHFARVAYKNHKHSQHNPYAQFQRVYEMEEILTSPMVFAPLTKLQCCPTSDGGGAAVLASEQFVVDHGLQSQAVLIAGMAMTTDFPSSFNEPSCMKIVRFEMTQRAAKNVYEQSGIGPEDVNVVELHDCFSANEMISYEALGLCGEGQAWKLTADDAFTYGGKVVVNPSGGLISKGHPLGATGLAQCAELTWQLRGTAGARQVPGAKHALQHNLGLGGAAVVTMYSQCSLRAAS